MEDDAPGWDELWDRLKLQAKVKADSLGSDDNFPGDHWAEAENWEEDEYKILEDAAREVDEVPKPTPRYYLLDALESHSWSKDVSDRLAECMGAVMSGAMITMTGTWVHDAIGAGALGMIGAGWGMEMGKYASKKALRNTVDHQNQAVSSEPFRKWHIRESLSENWEGTYGIASFNEYGFETVESVDGIELEQFLGDIFDEAEVKAREITKDDHPLKVIGLTATYDRDEAYQDYAQRRRLAAETEMKYGVSVEEVLQVGDNDETVPVADELPPEGKYEFAIVDIDTEYFSKNDDLRDHYNSTDGEETGTQHLEGQFEQ